MQRPQPKPGARGSSDVGASLAGDVSTSSKSHAPFQAVPETETAAWSNYVDAVIAFNTARTGANAQARAKCYQEFVSLFVGPDDDAGVLLKAEVVDIGEVRPRGAP